MNWRKTEEIEVDTIVSQETAELNELPQIEFSQTVIIAVFLSSLYICIHKNENVIFMNLARYIVIIGFLYTYITKYN